MSGNRNLVWIASGICFLLAGVVPALGQYEPPTYVVRYTNQPPVIDGQLTSPLEWAMADRAADDWVLMRSGINFSNDVPDPTGNRFVALWSDRGLYLQHQVDYGLWEPRGYGVFDWFYENLNLYFDPNKDGETNEQSSPLDTGIDGYQLTFNQPLGSSEILEVGTYMEAHVDSLFGDQGAPWSKFEGMTMQQTTSASPAFGYTELFIPWSDFDASNPDLLDPATDDIGLYHPDAPQDGHEWFFNIGRVETSGTAPIWAAAPGNGFMAQRPHGVLRFSKASAVLGDFNGDGMLTAIDINLLTAVVRSANHDLGFDLNNDQLVTSEDRDMWVEQIRNTFFGDGNLDGEFNTADLVDVFIAGEYEDGLAGNSLWETGDWDGNGEFDASDFVTAFMSGGFELGPKSGVRAVPEPSTVLLLLLGLLGLRLRRR